MLVKTRGDFCRELHRVHGSRDRDQRFGWYRWRIEVVWVWFGPVECSVSLCALGAASGQCDG
jgi:hypothetical protein